MDEIQTTRRDFCKGMMSMGAAGGVLLPFLASCASPLLSTNDSKPSPVANTGPTSIVWQTEHADIGTYSALADTFNAVNKHGIHVTVRDISSDHSHDDLAAILRAHQSSPDVISMDVIWTDEFASNGWVIPLDDLWPKSERQGYLSTPLTGSTYQGKLWAAPFRTDVGLLYYRADIITQPPQTWDELMSIASSKQAKDKVRYGYVWQGKPNEGLVCTFVEMLSSCGGSILDSANPKRVTINSSAAVQALTIMRSLETISPANVLTEDNSDAIWESGDAAFMRHWPTYIALTYNSGKQDVALHFDVAALPSSRSGIITSSCVGGWGLGINVNSKNKEAAWEFIHWMLQEDAQKFAAIDASFAVTLKSVYHDQSVLGQNPLYSKLPSIIEHAQLRPQSPKYQPMSQAIWENVHDALSGKVSIGGALANLQSKLQALV
ncbi:MAG: ABC transporter substrate-binding protein [Ktedonobacteraceae bacterium]|nr:ABC transporter substrate-binding protein [Ktedonobacteraceae bacterium]